MQPRKIHATKLKQLSKEPKSPSINMQMEINDGNIIARNGVWKRSLMAARYRGMCPSLAAEQTTLPLVKMEPLAAP